LLSLLLELSIKGLLFLLDKPGLIAGESNGLWRQWTPMVLNSPTCLLDSEFLVSLDSDFTGLFLRFLLDEQDLYTRRPRRADNQWSVVGP
jgi:hypothetical protein